MGAHGVLGSGALKAANTPSAASGTTIATRPDWHSPLHSAVAPPLSSSLFVVDTVFFFFFYLSACLYFPPSMLNSVAQEPQDLTFLTFSSVLPANLFLLKETHAWSYARQVFLVCWIFKNVCFPHFILHANSLTVGTSYGKESQENEFSFTQFRSSNCVIINLLFASVSALYRKKKYCQLGCLLFWRRGVARVPV